MKDEEIIKIVTANSTNKFIYDKLDDRCVDFIMQTLEKLDANLFKEINNDGKFSFDDLPIPFDKLDKEEEVETYYSTEVEDKLDDLLDKINKKGTNIEYSLAFAGEQGGKNSFSQMKEMGSSERQTCSYDWKWVEDYIKNCPSEINFALFHTHPNPLGVEFKTLFNENKEVLAKLGVKPNGLNLSLADLYVQMYLEELVKKYNKKIKTQSIVLMHDGNLVSFQTSNGVKMHSENIIQKKTEENTL